MKTMITPDTRYTKHFTISSYDVDASGRASFQSVCRYMQEIAALHAEEMGLGFHAMIKEKRAWVLAQMVIRMDNLPRFQEEIKIKTWSNGPDGRFAFRDFIISGSREETIGKASSSWLVIDIEQKSICRLDEYFPGHNYDKVYDVLGKRPGRVKPLKDGELKETLKVKFSDLDINGHVNNVRYIDFILDAYPLEFRMNNTLHEIEMNFLKESKAGQVIKVFQESIERDKEYHHTLYNESEGKPSFTAITRWY